MGTRPMTPGGTKVKASFWTGVAWKSQVQPRDALQHQLGAVELAGPAPFGPRRREAQHWGRLRRYYCSHPGPRPVGRRPIPVVFQAIGIYTQESKSLGRLIYGVISLNCALRLRLVFVYGYRAPVESMMSAGGARRWRYSCQGLPGADGANRFPAREISPAITHDHRDTPPPPYLRQGSGLHNYPR